MTTGQMIKLKRQELGLYQSELAEQVGVTQTHISDIERNKTNASIPVLKKIAKALKCNFADLIETEVSAWKRKKMTLLLQVSFMN